MFKNFRPIPLQGRGARKNTKSRDINKSTNQNMYSHNFVNKKDRFQRFDGNLTSVLISN